MIFTSKTMESEPSYGNWNIHLTPQQKKKLRQKIIRGGKIADQIRQMAKHHHETHEIPNAEKNLDQRLQEAPSTTKIDPIPEKVIEEKKKLSLWQKILKFLKRLFLP